MDKKKRPLLGVQVIDTDFTHKLKQGTRLFSRIGKGQSVLLDQLNKDLPDPNLRDPAMFKHYFDFDEITPQSVFKKIPSKQRIGLANSKDIASHGQASSLKMSKSLATHHDLEVILESPASVNLSAVALKPVFSKPSKSLFKPLKRKVC